GEARGRPGTTGNRACAAGRERLSLGLLGLHDGAALVRAILLGLDLDPPLALALILAGAGMAAIGGGAFALALAGVGAGALHRLAGVLLRGIAGEAMPAREHADDRSRYDKAQSLLTIHASVLLAELPGPPS